MSIKRCIQLALVCVGILAAADTARAGHAIVVPPSYYPQEIRIETVDPASAGVQLQKNTLQAYVGSTPHFTGGAPKELKAVESLGGFMVLSFNPASKRFRQRERRCSAAGAIGAALDRGAQEFRFSLYPVTPFHADYLEHLDQIEETQVKVRTDGAVDPGLKFLVRGERAQALVPSHWHLNARHWDVSLEEVAVADLIPPPMNGWLGPPWMKQGWFHAYRLLAESISEPAERRTADALYQRLVYGEYHDLTEQANLERRLTAVLTRGCERAVLGYTVRREYYNDSFSGIENIVVDSQLGLNSPVFIRAVKLKDYPWNGELHLGTRGRPEAAWNPVAGFSDAPGRLLWSAVGDAAQLPMPYNSSWMHNRALGNVELTSGAPGLKVPPDALAPHANSGTLRPVDEGKFSSASIVYRVSASRFHDGTRTAVADLLYPYVLAYRWGTKTADDDKTYDPAIATATAWLRERLVGLKVLRVEEGINEIAHDLQVPVEFPIVEVYVNYAALDLPQVAALAPPWNTVPWHLLVLMEEAVQRGFAAFSKEQAKRLAVPWLDLARDPALQARLRGLIEEFERNGYRPDALKDLVSIEAARERWHALKQFADDNNHLLVTNGPYRLKQWSNTSSVVQVDRELSYPHSIGSFDHFAYPPRAVITGVKQEANRVFIYVDVEKVVREQRNYTTVREPLKRVALRGTYRIRPDSHYVILGPDGSVVQVGAATMKDDGRFTAELPERLPRGRYTFMVGIYLDGNTIRPATRIISFEAVAS